FLEPSSGLVELLLKKLLKNSSNLVNSMVRAFQRCSCGGTVNLLTWGRAKRRFSELAREAFCNQDDACALQQRLDDEAKPVIAQGETLVLQHPRVAALHRPAPLAQP